MKKQLVACVAGILTLSVAMGLAGCGGKGAKAYSKADVTITAETDLTAAADISTDIFGIFLEDINYASQAMDDNMVANGSFEQPTQSYNRKWNTNATMSEGTGDGLTATARYAHCVFEGPDGYLANDGYDAVPMAVEKGKKYEFSAFLRATGYEGDIEVNIVDSELNSCAGGRFTVTKSDEWAKYVVTITADKTITSDAQFEMKFASTGTLDIDGVQFVTLDSTVGVKNYIFDAIKALQPRFMRFPGGCIIEGRSMTDAYDWKNSIGAVAEGTDDVVPTLSYKEYRDGTSTDVTTRGEPATRKYNGNLWAGSNYYEMEYGLGFYEYFLLCEAIGAKPVPIVNCGFSCQSRGGTNLPGRHNLYVPDYIQDAKDLICFANGDVNSSDPDEAYWAQVRTDMGHPEPFNMEYLGIGNEQWTDAYYSKYQQFLEAFKTADNPIYRTVTPIVGCGTQFHDAQRPGHTGLALDASTAYKKAGKISALSEYGIVDHHYYMGYLDFFRFAGKNCIYNSYDRGADKYEVFVGEYSANHTYARYSTSETTPDWSGNGNLPMPAEMNSWATALSEAAYMTGLERNGDIVRLAAYAPMFGVANGDDKDDNANQWAVDMMYFTNQDLLLSTNYYVQQLMMPNTGSKVLASEAVFSSESKATYTLVNSEHKPEKIESLYYVVSYDEETGDVLVKLVNASSEEMKINIDLTGMGLTSKGEVTYLGGTSLNAYNKLGDTQISPKTENLSGVSDRLGYTAPKYSVSVLRLHTK